MQQVYQMYGTGDGDGRAVIDVRTDGTIVAVYADMVTPDASAAGVEQLELSFASSSNFNNNDATSIIASGMAVAPVIVDAVTNVESVHLNLDREGMAVPVAAGERLHLHINTTGAARCVLNIVIDEKGGTRAVRRR